MRGRYSPERLAQLGQVLRRQEETVHATEMRPHLDFSLSTAQQLAQLRAVEADHEPERTEQ